MAVAYSTVDVTAQAGSDYTMAAGNLIFSPGQTSRTITVDVSGDTVYEGAETFFLNLVFASGATITDGQGVGTIINDDATPTLAINDVTVSESAGTMTFTVTRTGATEVPITVNYATADDSATGKRRQIRAIPSTRSQEQPPPGPGRPPV